MSVAESHALQTCHVLQEEPELAHAVPVARRQRAIEECIAHCAHLTPGRWRAKGTVTLDDDLGLLVLDGLLLRRVGIDGRFGAELLGQGDLLRPWQGEGDPPTLPVTTGWRVLQPTKVAVLDERFAQRLAAYPQVNARLIGKALQRARHLVVNMAIVHQAKVDVRLEMLLWHLADRWGKVCPEGVVLPLRLTHFVLADLVAARRPTVTSALSELQRRGRLENRAGTWLLRGEPPGELLELAAAGDLTSTKPLSAA